MRKALGGGVVGSLFLAGCGDGSSSPPNTTVTTTTSPAGPGDADRAQVLALALRQLVTVNNSFGPGHTFTELLVQSALDPAAGTSIPVDGPQRALNEAERTAIEAALSDLAPVRWIGDPAEGRTANLAPPLPRGPVSVWCGGVHGIWLTYRLTLQAGSWSVTGMEGQWVIS